MARAGVQVSHSMALLCLLYQVQGRVGCVIPPLIASANSTHSILPKDKFRSPRIELAYYVCITTIVLS